LPLPSGLGKTPATDKKTIKISRQTQKKLFRWMGTNVYFLDETLHISEIEMNALKLDWFSYTNSLKV